MSKTMAVSRLTQAELADVYGQLDMEEKRLSEMKNRIKAQIKTRDPAAKKVYGSQYTVALIEKSRGSFDKDAFIKKYGQKTYDHFYTKGAPYIEFRVDPIEETIAPKNEHVLSIEIPNFGVVTAGSTE